MITRVVHFKQYPTQIHCSAGSLNFNRPALWERLHNRSDSREDLVLVDDFAGFILCPSTGCSLAGGWGSSSLVLGVSARGHVQMEVFVNSSFWELRNFSIRWSLALGITSLHKSSISALLIMCLWGCLTQFWSNRSVQLGTLLAGSTQTQSCLKESRDSVTCFLSAKRRGRFGGSSR